MLLHAVLSALPLCAALAAPKPVNGAAFVRQSAPPAVMTPGAKATVSITLRNTGASSWTREQGYQLGAQGPADNALWRSGRVLLAPGETIRPGGSKTFRFEIAAPTKPGRHSFQWRMVRERVEWFGHPTEAVVVEVPAPAAPGCVDGVLKDPRAYFFSVLGRAEGSDASDWAVALRRSGLPKGPGPGAPPAADAPFFGITQQLDSSGNVRGRVFLPTASPDDNGYYLRSVDVLEGEPMRWAWKDRLGPEYAPRPCR